MKALHLLMFAAYFPLSTVYSEINIMGITVSNKKYNFFHNDCENLIDRLIDNWGIEFTDIDIIEPINNFNFISWMSLL